MYLWIAIGSYSAAAVLGLYMLSTHTSQQAELLRSGGAGQEAIDELYRMMGRMLPRALLQATIITGSVLAALGSLIAWFLTS